MGKKKTAKKATKKTTRRKAAAGAGRKASRGRAADASSKILDIRNLTATDLGLIFGVTKQAVGQWHRDRNCPRGEDGKYDLIAVVEWWKGWQLEQVATESEAMRNLEESKARKAKYDADLREIELARQKGKLVPRDEMIERERAIAVMFRRNMENIPRRMNLKASERKALETEICDALTSLAQAGLEGSW